jgi:3-methyladenine DNA glycosylase AlkD
MELQETMRELESLGSEQTRKTFLRHGAPEPLFGVKFGDLEKLRKRIKTNAGLAEALWDTGHSDARMLATMVADAAAMSWEHLDAWARALNWHSLVDVFVSNVAVHSPHFRKAVETWAALPGEMQRRAGWQLLAALATKTTQLADEELAPWLPRIEQGIHTAQNRVREAMNTALISIGGRGGALQEQALEVARRIGKVEVFHGDTACETPDAAESIAKVRAHKEGGVAKATALAKNAVDSVKGMAAGAAHMAAAGAQSVASGAKSAVASAKNVVSEARNAVTSAQDAVSDMAEKAATNARDVVSGMAEKAAANARDVASGMAEKAAANARDVASASGAAKRAASNVRDVASGAAKRASLSARGNGAAKKAPLSAKKNGAARKAPPSAKKAGAAKKATPAPAARKAAVKKATAKKAAPTSAGKAATKRAAPATAKKAPAKKTTPATAKKAAAPARGKTGAKKGARPRA